MDFNINQLTGFMGDTYLKTVEGESMIQLSTANLSQPSPNMAAAVHWDTAREEAVNKNCVYRKAQLHP